MAQWITSQGQPNAGLYVFDTEDEVWSKIAELAEATGSLAT